MYRGYMYDCLCGDDLTIPPNHRVKAETIESWRDATQCDTLLVVVDAGARISDEMKLLKNKIDTVMQVQPTLKVHLILNKMDRCLRGVVVPPRMLNFWAEKVEGKGETTSPRLQQQHRCSALTGEGLQELTSTLLACTPHSHWLYAPSASYTLSRAEMTTELIREQLFRRLNQDVPYRIDVSLQGWSPQLDGSLRLDALLTVPNSSVQRMVVGTNGSVLTWIGSRARVQLARVFGMKVHLFLRVSLE